MSNPVRESFKEHFEKEYITKLKPNHLFSWDMIERWLKAFDDMELVKKEGGFAKHDGLTPEQEEKAKAMLDKMLEPYKDLKPLSSGKTIQEEIEEQNKNNAPLNKGICNIPWRRIHDSE